MRWSYFRFIGVARLAYQNRHGDQLVAKVRDRAPYRHLFAGCRGRNCIERDDVAPARIDA